MYDTHNIKTHKKIINYNRKTKQFWRLVVKEMTLPLFNKVTDRHTFSKEEINTFNRNVLYFKN